MGAASAAATYTPLSPSGQGSSEDIAANDTPFGVLEALLLWLADVSHANNRGVRFRACQLIGSIMSGMPEDAEISDEVFDVLRDALLERFQDKYPVVRAAAVRGAARLPVPDEVRLVVCWWGTLAGASGCIASGIVSLVSYTRLT